MSPTTPEAISPVIGVIIFLAIIAALVLAAKGGMTKKAGAVGGWFANLFTSAGGNKFWTAMLLIGLYLLILTAVSQLRPDLWHWLKKPGWFFFLWLVIGLPTAIAIINNAKLKFGRALALAWLVITLLAADWTPVKEWMDRHEIAESRAIGTASATRSPVTTKTIVARPDEFSEMVSIPAYHDFRLLPEGKVMVRTASGRQWEDWKGKSHDAGRNLRLHDAIFQFMSLEKDEEVEVTVEWEPK